MKATGWTLIGIGALVALLFAFSAYGHWGGRQPGPGAGMGYGPGHGMGYGMGYRGEMQRGPMAEAMQALPPDQREQLRTMHQAHRQQMATVAVELDTARGALRDAMQAYPLDSTAAQAAFDKLGEVQRQMFALRMAFMAQMQQVLGEEAWQRMHERMEAGAGAGMGPGMQPGQGMGPGAGMGPGMQPGQGMGPGMQPGQGMGPGMQPGQGMQPGEPRR